MDEKTKKAFDFAQDVTKQLITLATAVITITVTFLKDIATDAPKGARVWLELAWLLYVVSIPFGVLTLMGLTSNLEDPAPNIRGLNVRVPAAVQILCFTAALALTVVFGRKALA
jgi:hypothetical protein